MSNLQRLRDNIAAIECALKGENNLDVLNKYTGFGGLGFVLNPIEDKTKWNKTDAVCYDDTRHCSVIIGATTAQGSTDRCSTPPQAWACLPTTVS